MVRQTIKNDVPELWKKRAKAGLCPVCGKTNQEFAKGMIVYCSVKCRDEYASHYELWGTLRDKILKRDNNTCQECGTNEEKVKKNWESSKKDVLNKFFEKEKREIEVFRDIELKKISEKYEEEYKEIMDDVKLFSRIRWELQKQFEKDYPEIFTYHWKSPSFCADHIRAIVNGGDMWDEKNLRCLCEECHKKKTQKDLLERKRRKINTKELKAMEVKQEAMQSEARHSSQA